MNNYEHVKTYLAIHLEATDRQPAEALMIRASRLAYLCPGHRCHFSC
jgi:hypothetical protein